MSLRRLILVVILDGPCTLVVPGPDLVERCPKLPSFACGGHMMRRCGAGNENRQRRSGDQARAGESCARSGPAPSSARALLRHVRPPFKSQTYERISQLTAPQILQFLSESAGETQNIHEATPTMSSSSWITVRPQS